MTALEPLVRVEPPKMPKALLFGQLGPSSDVSNVYK